MQKKQVSFQEGLIKLQRYCAYQERCHSEVQQKLYDIGVWKNDAENIVVKLIEDNFLNEERFAESYVRGKFVFKQWGKTKIKLKLKEKKVSDYCINKALAQIDDSEYRQTLEKLLKKKRKDYYPKHKGYALQAKLMNFALSKGYELDVVREVVVEDN
jgi:regulatory protein